MTKPLVTVGLQFYNSELTIKSAVRSILNQTLQEFEFLIHDDGSSDQGNRIVQDFTDSRIRHFRDSRNLLRSNRLNQSIELARGRFYAVMDADDVSYPDRLQRQVEFLLANPSVDLVGGGMLVFADGGEVLGKRQFPTSHAEICGRPWSGFPLAQPTFMGRLEWFRKYSYDTRAEVSQDQDLLLRSYARSTFANLPGIVTAYRESGLLLRKVLRSRYDFAGSLLRQVMRENRLLRGFAILTEQCAKGSIDAIAAITHSERFLVPHRARPISFDEHEKWLEVWGSVQ